MSRDSGKPRTGGRFPVADWGIRSGRWLPDDILMSGWLWLQWVCKTPSRTGTQTGAPSLKHLWETCGLETQCSSWPPPFLWRMVVSVERWILPSWRTYQPRWGPWCFLVTKSMEMSDHGLEGMGNGWRSPVRALEDVLFHAQTEHASMYSRTSGSIAGHQYLRDMRMCHGSFDSRMAWKQRGVSPMNHLWT